MFHDRKRSKPEFKVIKPYATTYINLYFMQSLIKGEKYRLITMEFGRYYEYEGEDGKKYRSALLVGTHWTQTPSQLSFPELVGQQMKSFIDVYRKANRGPPFWLGNK